MNEKSVRTVWQFTSLTFFKMVIISFLRRIIITPMYCHIYSPVNIEYSILYLKFHFELKVWYSLVYTKCIKCTVLSHSHTENPLWIISMLKSSKHKEYSNSFEMPHTHTTFFFFLSFCYLLSCSYRVESMTKKYVFSTTSLLHVLPFLYFLFCK